MDELTLKCYLAILTGMANKNQVNSESAFPAIATNARKLAQACAAEAKSPGYFERSGAPEKKKV